MHDTMRVMTPAPELLPLLKVFYPFRDPQWAWAYDTLMRDATAEALRLEYENPGRSFFGASGPVPEDEGLYGIWVYEKLPHASYGDSPQVKLIGAMRYADFGVSP